MLAALTDGTIHLGMEARVEVSNDAVPLRASLGDGVEVLLDTRREVVVHDVGELLDEEVIDDDTDVCR